MPQEDEIRFYSLVKQKQRPGLKQPLPRHTNHPLAIHTILAFLFLLMLFSGFTFSIVFASAFPKNHRSPYLLSAFLPSTLQRFTSPALMAPQPGPQGTAAQMRAASQVLPGEGALRSPPATGQASSQRRHLQLHPSDGKNHHHYYLSRHRGIRQSEAPALDNEKLGNDIGW